jgi:hypothetical protein
MNGFILLMGMLLATLSFLVVSMLIEKMNKKKVDGVNRFKPRRKAINPHRKINFSDWK